MITLQQVSKNYPKKQALSNISLSIPQGEMTFLSGNSGAGKSTLLKVLAGYEIPDPQSKVIINGIDITKLNASEMAYYRRKIGFVDQIHQLLPNRTVFENISLPLYAMGFNEKKLMKRVQTVLTKVDMLDKIHQYPYELSTGEQQRISIARAIANRPFLLLADEPTGNLDQELTLKIMDLLIQFQSIGSTIIIATHDTHLIETMQYKTIYLKKGVLCAHK